VDSADLKRKEECSFLKKRTKKLLSVEREPKYPKVFCFFFSKKKAFLPLRPAPKTRWLTLRKGSPCLERRLDRGARARR
jgi:hypothetical protein